MKTLTRTLGGVCLAMGLVCAVIGIILIAAASTGRKARTSVQPSAPSPGGERATEERAPLGTQTTPICEGPGSSSRERTVAPQVFTPSPFDHRCAAAAAECDALVVRVPIASNHGCMFGVAGKGSC